MIPGGGEGEKARRSIRQASHVMPPRPEGTCFCHGDGRGRRNCLLCVGVVQSLPCGGRWRGGGGGGEVLWRFQPCKGLGRRARDAGGRALAHSRPRSRGPAPGLLQLFTSRIVTQEKQLISLRGKSGSIHHSIYNTAKMSCQNKRTHTHTHTNTVNRKTQGDNRARGLSGV